MPSYRYFGVGQDDELLHETDRTTAVPGFRSRYEMAEFWSAQGRRAMDSVGLNLGDARAFLDTAYIVRLDTDYVACATDYGAVPQTEQILGVKWRHNDVLHRRFFAITGQCDPLLTTDPAGRTTIPTFGSYWSTDAYWRTGGGRNPIIRELWIEGMPGEWSDDCIHVPVQMLIMNEDDAFSVIDTTPTLDLSAHATMHIGVDPVCDVEPTPILSRTRITRIRRGRDA